MCVSGRLRVGVEAELKKQCAVFHVLSHLNYFIQYIIIDNVGGKFNKMAPILEFLIISTGSRTCIWTRDGTLSFHSL